MHTYTQDVCLSEYRVGGPYVVKCGCSSSFSLISPVDVSQHLHVVVVIQITASVLNVRDNVGLAFRETTFDVH